jgi:hypothetical protein
MGMLQNKLNNIISTVFIQCGLDLLSCDFRVTLFEHRAQNTCTLFALCVAVAQKVPETHIHKHTAQPSKIVCFDIRLLSIYPMAYYLLSPHGAPLTCELIGA